MKILNSTDLDKAFFTNVEKKMNTILNSIRLFFSNIFIILLSLVLLYGNVNISDSIRIIFDIIMCLIGGVSIIALISCELGIKNFKLNNFIIKYDRNIIKGILIFICIYAVILILNVTQLASLADLTGFNIFAIFMISIVCSTVSMIFIGVVKNIAEVKNKMAKFYFYRKLKDNEKYFIYYSKDKDNVVCGENEDFELADKIVIIPLREIMENYTLFRVQNDRRKEKMKVLTIKQPWATLIMQGDKRFEFRSWKTKYRGELLIHAGNGADKEAIKRLGKYLPETLPYGKILGKVKLVDCIKMSPEFKELLLKENSDIYTKSTFEANYGWQIADVEAFENPIEVKGHLGLWNYEI